MDIKIAIAIITACTTISGVIISQVISSFNPDIPANAGGQGQVHSPDKIKKVTQDLFKSKDKIIEALQDNVKKYTKA